MLFWVLLWQMAAFVWKDSLVFVGPLDMLKALVEQMGDREFWLSLLRSMACILGGFLAAFTMAILLSAMAFCLPYLKLFLEPIVTLQKSVPVASFVVLFLILIGSKYLAVVIVFFMAFPILYINMTEGLSKVDESMLEMAKVYRMPFRSRVLYIYRPALWPFLLSGTKIAVGMSWKSGVAAEIIGVPSHSIGEQLYMAKIYLNTDRLFAWTLVIILLSMASERLIMKLLKRLGGRT